jgi:hypothetical protein
VVAVRVRDDHASHICGHEVVRRQSLGDGSPPTGGIDPAVDQRDRFVGKQKSEYRADVPPRGDHDRRRAHANALELDDVRSVKLVVGHRPRMHEPQHR